MLSALVLRTLLRRAPIHVRVAQNAPVFARGLFSSSSLLYAAAKSAKTTVSKSASASPKKAVARTSSKSSVKSKSKAKSKVKAKISSKSRSLRRASSKSKKRRTAPRVRPIEFTTPPKQPSGAFFLFLMENKPKYNSVEEARSYASASATKWTALSAEQKQPYVSKARGLMEQYKKEKEKWLKNTSHIGLLQYRRRLRARKAKRAVKDSQGQRIRLPGTSFGTFFRERQAEFRRSTDSSSDNLSRMKRAATAWKALNALEKEEYKKRYETALSEYRSKVSDVRQ